MEEKTKHQKGKEYTTEKPALLCGHEEFKQGDKSLGFNVMDYWRFQHSNLIDNIGCVAEFLVARTQRSTMCTTANFHIFPRKFCFLVEKRYLCTNISIYEDRKTNSSSRS